MNKIGSFAGEYNRVGDMTEAKKHRDNGHGRAYAAGAMFAASKARALVDKGRTAQGVANELDAVGRALLYYANNGKWPDWYLSEVGDDGD